jgi:hypothetical protein
VWEEIPKQVVGPVLGTRQSLKERLLEKSIIYAVKMFKKI